MYSQVNRLNICNIIKYSSNLSQLNSEIIPYSFKKDGNVQSLLRGMKVGKEIRYISGYIVLPFAWSNDFTIVELYEYSSADSQGCLVGEGKIYPISLNKEYNIIRCDDATVPAGKYYLSIMFTV